MVSGFLRPVSDLLRWPVNWVRDFITRRRHFNKTEIIEIIDRGAQKEILQFQSGDLKIVFKGGAVKPPLKPHKPDKGPEDHDDAHTAPPFR